MIQQPQQPPQPQQPQQLSQAQPGAPQQAKNTEKDNQELKDLIQRVFRNDSRERAIFNLSKKADKYTNIGIMLWNTPGIIPIFVQEIVSAYPLLAPNVQPPKTALNRVSSVLTLLQKMSSDENARKPLVESEILQYLLPFLRMEYNKSVDTLRVATLGVIGMLMRSSNKEIVSYLVHRANIFPLCLAAMTLQAEPTKGIGKILSTFIVEKLLQDEGLQYICQKAERREQVMATLAQTIPLAPTDDHTRKLLRHCVRCYANLCKAEEGRQIVRERLPEELRKEYSGARNYDESMMKSLNELYVLMEKGDTSGK